MFKRERCACGSVILGNRQKLSVTSSFSQQKLDLGCAAALNAVSEERLHKGEEGQVLACLKISDGVQC